MALVPASNRGTDPNANVDSVFGRTGVVVAASGDYTAAQVTNAANKANGGTEAFSGLITAAGEITARQGDARQVRIGTAGSAGGVLFGSATDCSISRVGANALTTDSVLTLTLGAKTTAITSGALPTVSPASGTAFQCTTARDVSLVVPVTYNGAAADATCLVEISPDNVTFSAVGTETEKLGSVNGDVRLLSLRVPAGWRVKLTVTNATLGTGTYY